MNRIVFILIVPFSLMIMITMYIFFINKQKKHTTTPIYTFIHPTKTGGTACETFFQKHYSEFIQGNGHDNKCSNTNNPIIIIRDPIDRFVSMYKYWKYGSLDIDNFKRSESFINDHKKYSIKDFIALIKNKQYTELHRDFTWNQHFAPIVEWINNTPYKNIIVIQYEKNLNEKINKLLKLLNIKNKNIELPLINISNNKEDIQLDDNDILFIKTYFNVDFELYDDINNRPYLFKHVI